MKQLNYVQMKTIVIFCSIVLIYFFSIVDVFAQGSWITVSSTATTCYAQSNAYMVIGSKAYIGMGTDYCHDWVMYDPVLDTWTSKATLADTASDDPPAFSLGGYGYVLCDNKHLWQYDTLADSWARKADCPGNIGEFPYFFSIADTGYVTGGTYSGSGNFYKELWAYNSANNTWSRKADMPQGNSTG